ncbi:hypothetical protein NIES4072_26000 [Nostoc commune NIES-4072]|uniref:Uncharacterized protein n=1 Tax=Nostoc commune NIES-4072 TaxID=2005467 RepID=A0A2R5FKY7_NOSCO|nr:hypothetical protein NIES4070_00860 [Nostoc commune HK-02]GBG18935.1 hypothetical protein NIES4072_26000 [Nostoc commune NIES-4072]
MESEVTGFKVKTPVGDLGLSTEKEKFFLALGIGEITAKTKSNPMKLNQYLGLQKTRLLEAINQELLEPAMSLSGRAIARSLMRQSIQAILLEKIALVFIIRK